MSTLLIHCDFIHIQIAYTDHALKMIQISLIYFHHTWLRSVECRTQNTDTHSNIYLFASMPSNESILLFNYRNIMPLGDISILQIAFSLLLLCVYVCLWLLLFLHEIVVVCLQTTLKCIHSFVLKWTYTYTHRVYEIHRNVVAFGNIRASIGTNNSNPIKW